jgi:hypothetical protein
VLTCYRCVYEVESSMCLLCLNKTVVYVKELYKRVNKLFNTRVGLLFLFHENVNYDLTFYDSEIW